MKTAESSEQAEVMTNLNRFDELDFEAFNKQNWELFNQIHAGDVTVVFPDGHKTNGIKKHDDDMKAMFAWAPDLKVVSHPIKFGACGWTVVTGILTGTFTRPMTLPDGTTVQPTGRSFTLPMCTVAHWKDGRIVEEQLYWDSGAMMKQIGV